jgi:hypothetical protein
VAALSGLALWRVRSRVTWGLGAGVLVTVLFSLGKYAPWINWPMFNYFPFFDAFRAPETWLSVSALGLAMLAGIGLDYCLRRDEGRRDGTDKRRSMLYAFGAVGGVVLLLLVGRGVFFDFESRREAQVIKQIEQRPNLTRSNPRVQQFYRQLEQRKQQRRDALQASAMRTLLALGVALLLLWLYRRKSLAAWGAGGLVILVVVIDLWGVDRRYLGSDDFSNRPDRASLISTYDYHRFINDQVQKAGGPGRFRVLPLQTPEGRSPMNNPIASYHYESIGGAHPAKLQIYQEYIDHILGLAQGSRPNENALDLLSTRYIVANQKLPGTSVAFRSQGTKAVVLNNPDAVPRGFLVGQTEVVEAPKATWRRLRDPSFDPQTTALLAEPLDAPVTPIDSSSTAEVTMESFDLEEIEWTVRTDAPRFFVASEVYYPAGWNAYLDGEKVPIHRTDYLLRGVHVPEGEHTLVMRFEPSIHRYSTLVAGGSTALVYGGLLVMLAVRHRRRLREWLDALRGDSEEA